MVSETLFCYGRIEVVRGRKIGIGELMLSWSGVSKGWDDGASQHDPRDGVDSRGRGSARIPDADIETQAFLPTPSKSPVRSLFHIFTPL